MRPNSRCDRRARWVLAQGVFGAAAVSLVMCAAAPTTRALEPNEWQTRQIFAVAGPGMIKLALPPATLDATRANLEDLRLLDAAGRETPFLIERALRTVPSATRAPRSFRTTLAEATQLVIETGLESPLDAVVLLSPAAGFIKAARVEISTNGAEWRLLQAGAPVFRQLGAEQLGLDLQRQSAAYVRITLDDARSEPVPFTGARLILAPADPRPAGVPLAVAAIRREEFAGETVFTMDVGARNIPLASLEFPTSESLFVRNIAVGVRELHDDVAVERPLATGTIYRVAADGLAARGRLELPLDFAAPSRELIIHVANGDSPPLALEELHLRQHPVWLIFRAPESGTFTLLSGNGQVPAPRYDLAALGNSLRGLAASDITVGPLATNPSYRQLDPLANATLKGAALDPTPWAFRKPVKIGGAGVQQLELDLDVLARAQPGLFDLRLVQEGTQVPYLVERPGVTRSAPLAFVPQASTTNPRLSRWEIKLPRRGLPLARLTLTSPSTLFQRQVRLLEIITDERSGRYERTLAELSWSHAPGQNANLVFIPGGALSGDTLVVETDNGDNPPIVLGTVAAAFPVTRLLFKADEPDAASAAKNAAGASRAGVALYYGNRQASPPRYDLALMGAQILASEKKIAALGAEEAADAGGWAARALGGMRGGVVLWGVLALVVVVLLLVVAKLLPKPPVQPPG